jgi:hypothetical protein
MKYEFTITQPDHVYAIRVDAPHVIDDPQEIFRPHTDLSSLVNNYPERATFRVFEVRVIDFAPGAQQYIERELDGSDADLALVAMLRKVANLRASMNSEMACLQRQTNSKIVLECGGDFKKATPEQRRLLGLSNMYIDAFHWQAKVLNEARYVHEGA